MTYRGHTEHKLPVNDLYGCMPLDGNQLGRHLASLAKPQSKGENSSESEFVLNHTKQRVIYYWMLMYVFCQ